ncbi:uncharacterized protein MONBRDRAFT_26710 [Monosiga brevicollis MX1]|uniref:Prolyl 4-hydroxylase alpha subunit domain-containing protein n=1 Tax=Monosiga brevicollis TaxID=81824 RepID=A9V352_MONBE|nr:uncharacterized protein MONBRDRAFT_26710 [Monosiga brevicollis MX1]EDQ88128.1 predicted protein [Monosiga brevicollis MX1]|eukprot:XP_001747204.1 hypothetical protein [Monosiga brevicollis MX1]
MIRSPAVALSLVLAVTVVHLNSLRFAEKMRDADIIEPTIPEHLVVWDPVEVNFTRRVRLDDSGRIYTMRTMATNPPIFGNFFRNQGCLTLVLCWSTEIEDFLTGEECETILSLAGKQGLFKSDHTYLDGSNLAEKDKDTTQLSEDEANNLFRFSDQTWLAHDSHRHLRSMYRRLQRLARLPDHVMPQVEQMQVVRYNRHGHYESHFDSEADHLGPCCIDPVARGFDTGVRALERPLEKRCRLCRYMTVLYYLVDTEQGGGVLQLVVPRLSFDLRLISHWESQTFMTWCGE